MTTPRSSQIFAGRRKSPPACRIWAVVVALLFAGLGSARAELDLAAFTGIALTQDGDLDLHQAGATDLTFHDVSFEGRDFDAPPYYGLRALWFASEDSHWGFGAEFFHAKVYANTGDTVHVTGRRGGVRVNDEEPVDRTIESFSLSHGLNFPLADLVYRWLPARHGGGFLERIQPYVGVGVGAVVPHVETKISGIFHEEYQFHGPGVQALAGVNFDLAAHFGLMLEYKFTYANLESLNVPGGSIDLQPLTHHLVGGITFHF